MSLTMAGEKSKGCRYCVASAGASNKPVKLWYKRGRRGRGKERERGGEELCEIKKNIEKGESQGV